MAKPQHGSKEPKWFNWLAHLDAEVSKLPVTATSWEYSAFTLARFPRLQPTSDEDELDELNRRSVRGWLANYEARISSDQDAKRTVEGLNDKQKMQLAALVAETTHDVEISSMNPVSTDQKHLKKAPAERRIIARKVASTRKALLALRDCAAEKGLHGLMFDGSFEDCLANFDGFAREMGRKLKSHHSFTSFCISSSRLMPNPISYGMVKLYWFFRHGCNRTGKESEVRTALIRNAFWTQHGVPSVDLLLKYRGAGESKGCTAVRLAVSRFRPDRGTSH